MKIKSKIKIPYHQFVCFAFLVIFHFYLVGQSSVREILNTMPKDEKEALEKLFYNLFNRNNFSYTLFGDKPLSLSAYFTTSFDHEGIPSNRGISIWKKWAVWKKYAPSFPMTRYLLIEEPFDRGDSKSIYFINKKSFVNKVNEHLNVFQEVLGENITGKLLLEKIEEDPKFLFFLNDDSLLLGILLGYGEHNARLFNNRNKLSPFVFRKEFPTIPIKIPLPSEGFTSLQDEFNSYFSILTLFGDTHYLPLMIHSVHFVADHQHPETITLQNKYRKQRGKISAIYAKGNFLEITLSQLISE